MMAQDKTYNGWSNYATWRINLEIFDNFDISDYDKTPYELSEQLKDYADEILCMDQKNLDNEALALSYARAFMDEVNFYEIAEALLDAYIEEEEDETL
jgi:hypothetical protein